MGKQNSIEMTHFFTVIIIIFFFPKTLVADSRNTRECNVEHTWDNPWGLGLLWPSRANCREKEQRISRILWAEHHKEKGIKLKNKCSLIDCK